MSEHDQTSLGAYVLGGLEPDEVREVEEHLAGCAECRAELVELEEMKEFLGEVPPEAFLDGPPTDGDLMLQRTLREVRAVSAPSEPVPAAPAVAKKRGRWLAVAAAVVVVAGAIGGGVLIGRQTADTTPVAADTPPAGTKQVMVTRCGYRYDDGGDCRTTRGLELGHRQHRGAEGRGRVPDVRHRQVRQDVGAPGAGSSRRRQRTRGAASAVVCWCPSTRSVRSRSRPSRASTW